MKNAIIQRGLLVLALTAGLTTLRADTFGSGGNTFTIDFTSIGNVGNSADTTGYGSVNYYYDIGIYDISQNQLNKAAANGLVGVPGGAWSGDQPAANVSWYQAAAFVNWLNTSTGHQAAYKLTYSGGAYTMALWQSGDSGYDPSNPFRNSLALYVLPSQDEWYKAAYYNPGANGGSGGYNLYPAGSNVPTAVISGTNAGTAVYSDGTVNPSVPASVYLAGGPSAYGTVGQGGNVYQWDESSPSGINNDPAGDKVIRGGRWNAGAPSMLSGTVFGYSPDTTANIIGFRVAAIPEPSVYALFALGLLLSVAVVRARKHFNA